MEKPYLTSCRSWKVERFAMKRTAFPSESLKKDHPDHMLRPIVVQGSVHFWLWPILQFGGKALRQTKHVMSIWLALGQAADNTN